MKLSLAALAWITAIAVAGPLKQSTGSTIQRRLDLNAILADTVCKVDKLLKPSLGFLFPPAKKIGTVVGPVLKDLIGEKNLETIDKAADDLGMSVVSTTLTIRVLTYYCSTSAENGDHGIPQDILGVAYAISQEKSTLNRVKLYKCLLNLLCV
jgi:hypothetical protein